MTSIFFMFRRSLFGQWAQLITIACLSCVAVGFTSYEQNVQAQTATKPGSITLKSDIQESNSQTGVITARGNVKINYPARQIQATATQAQYFSRERRLILTGNVYVIQEGNSMRAESMTYLIDEGRFVATPQGDRQVESTYIITNPQ